MVNRGIVGIAAVLGVVALTGVARATRLQADRVPPRVARQLDEWRAQHGRSWHAHVSPRTGRVELLFGGRMAAPFVPGSDDDYRRLAQAAIARAADLHGIERETLRLERVLALPLARIGTTDKVAVKYRQLVDRVPVEGGFVNVLLDVDGSLLALQSTALPDLGGLSTTPAVSAEDARALGHEVFTAETGLPPTRTRGPELVVDLRRGGEGRAAVLAWRVDVQAHLEATVPEGFTYWLDAANGAVLRSAPSVHHCDVTGTLTTLATPGLAPDTDANPEVELPCAHLTLDSDQGVAVTGPDGSFTFFGPSTVTNVRVRYEGFFADVEDFVATDYELFVPVISGSGNALLMNPGATQFVTAQANAYRHVTSFRDWVWSVNGADNTMDFVAIAHPNLKAICNAYYDGVSTNYFAAGGDCPNTAYSTVIAHEQGHWANDLYGIGNGWDGMGEGNADVFAMFIYDTPIVGEDFIAGSPVRDGNNLRQYCGDNNGGCYGEVHADGEVWMGAAWKIRTNLKASLGDALGGDTADFLFMAWVNAFNQTTIHSVIESQWLTLDDTNANIDDGTPNYEVIDAAFQTQGFPGFDLSLIDITDVTEVQSTNDQVGPYVVSADVQVVSFPPLVDVSVHYSAGGAPYQSVIMPPIGGDIYQGGIPGQAAPVTVRYYVSATDFAGNVITFPAEAPDDTMFFMVGELNDAFVDLFDTDLGWTVENEDLLSGAWERGDPEGTMVGSLEAQPEDDSPVLPFSHQCYVTGLLAGSFPGEHDVDDGPTRLLSPLFDLGVGDGTVRYAYWLFNDQLDDELTVELSNDAGQNWVLLAEYQGGLGGWEVDEFHVGSHVAPSSQMQLRFSVADNPNGSITEAAIDDVLVRRLEPAGCSTPTNYCTPFLNSTGNPAVISFTGSASVAANDLGLVANDCPAGNNGLFIYSPDQAQTPLGDGVLCLGSSTLGFVLRLPAVTTDGTGTATFAFDVNTPPDPAGLVSPGELWFFQFWFRDPAAMGAGFNFSDGLSVTFCP